MCTFLPLSVSLCAYDFVVIEIAYTLHIFLYHCCTFIFHRMLLFVSRSPNLLVPSLYTLLLLLFRLMQFLLTFCIRFRFLVGKNTLHLCRLSFLPAHYMGPAVSMVFAVWTTLLIVIIRLFFSIFASTSGLMVFLVNTFFYLYLFFSLLFLMPWLRRAVYMYSVYRDQIHNNCVYFESPVLQSALPMFQNCKLIGIVCTRTMCHSIFLPCAFFSLSLSMLLTDLCLCMHFFFRTFPLCPLFVSAQMWIMWNSIY